MKKIIAGSLFVFLCLVLFVNLTYASGTLSFFDTGKIKTLIPNDWVIYENTAKIKEVMPNNNQTESIHLLLRDEKNIDKYLNAFQNKNVNLMMKNYPNNYMIILQKANAKITRENLETTADIFINHIKNSEQNFTLMKKTDIENQDGKKGIHIVYTYGAIANFVTLYNHNNYIISINGSTMSHNQKVIDMIYKVSNNLHFNNLN